MGNKNDNWSPTNTADRKAARKRTGPAEGYSWNPLLSFPRNKPCFCKSGKKFKKCCLSELSRTIKNKYVESLQTILKQT